MRGCAVAEVTQEQCRRILKLYIEKHYGTQKAFAEAIGVSGAHVSAILSGSKSMPLSFLDLIGARVRVRYLVSDEMAQWVRLTEKVMEVRRG